MSHLYIHVPLCRAKCAYCDFYSAPRHQLQQPLVRRLIDELNERAADRTFQTAYIGGGTPSSLEPKLLLRLITEVRRRCPQGEFTIEVNPEDVDHSLALMLARSGINRVSIGVQTLDDAELLAVGRRHTARQALQAIDTLRSAGITEISADIIYGLPGQTLHLWSQTLSTVLSLRLPHLSAYCLSYEPGTRLTARLRAGQIQEADDRLIQQMYQHLCRESAAAGYQHYEIANFALPSHHSRHNSAYWQSRPYLGIGPGAHSYDGIQCRSFVTPDINQYVAQGHTSLIQYEDLSNDELHNDYCLTRLRTAHGIDVDEYQRLWHDDLQAILAPFILDGTVIHTHSDTDKGTLRIAESHWLRADTVIRQLFRV